MSASSIPLPAMPSPARGGGHARSRLVICAAVWSALLIVAAAAILAPEHGYGVLYFASMPMVLTGLVALLLRPRAGLGQRVGRAIALGLCVLAFLAVSTSFIAVTFLMLPTVVLLISATVRPAGSYR